MANLYEILANAQQGQAIDELAREFGLSREQTEAAIAALLPAISLGLKRATATPDGLGDVFALMGGRPALQAMYTDPRAAFSPEGRDAANAALSQMFGTPEASRAIADQAQQFSGIGSAILKKLLPIVVGMILSGLMRSRSGEAAPPPSRPQQQPQPQQQQGGGGLFDILREIFPQQGSRPSGPAPDTGGISSIGDLMQPKDGMAEAPAQAEPASPTVAQPPSPPVDIPSGDPAQSPAEGSGPIAPGSDILGQILRELEKGIREGRVRPVVVGPDGVNVPGKGSQPGPTGPGAGQQPNPGADIFGQILKDLFGGGSRGASQQFAQTGNAGTSVFGELLEAGPDLDQQQLEQLQEVFDRFVTASRK